MPDSKYGQLPMSLVEDTRFKNKSIYVSDYCSRKRQIPARRRAKTKETLRYAEDIYNPSTRFLNDHYQTSSHNDLRSHCQKILNSIDRSSSRADVDLIKGGRAPVYNGIPQASYEQDNDEPIAQLLPPSLRRIETAWQEEVNTTKRERGNIYGKAGAKQWYHQRLKEDAAKRTNPKMIPGLTKWLNEANEFEKVVVHDFMKNVSDTIRHETTSSEMPRYKLSSDPDKLYYSENPKIEDFLDVDVDKGEQPALDRAISPPSLPGEEELFLDDQITQQPLQYNQFSQDNLEREIEEYKNVTFRNPTRETLVTPQERKLLQSRASSRSSTNLNQKEFSKGHLERAQSALAMYSLNDNIPDVQRPKSSLGIYDPKRVSQARPTSSQASSRSTVSLNRRAKSAEVPTRSATPEVVQRVYSAGSNRNNSHTPKKHTHNDPNCATCQQREIKKMAEKLAGMKPRSFDNLKKEKRDKPKMALSKMYKPSFDEYNPPADDYIYNQSVFGKVSAKDRGYFVIHPEWVSETMKPKKSYR